MTASTAGSTAAFLEGLGRRGHEPLLERVQATVRFDVVDSVRTEQRLVSIDHGDIRVSAGEGPADCVLVGDGAVFDAVIDGRTSAMAALLRGALEVDGDPQLLVLAQRLFRVPQVHPGHATGAGRRSS
jgi:hypothetical protein